MSQRFAAAVLLAAFPLFLVGCGPSPIGAAGSVTLDGKPLDEAGVQFVPIDSEYEARMTAAPVTAGRYELPDEDGLLPGTYRVAFVDVPPLGGPSRNNPGLRRPFPYRYSSESPITIEVDPEQAVDGRMQFDFELTLRP